MANTLAGRSEMAQQLLSAGLIKTPEQYLQVVQTGRLDVMTEGPTHELLSIKEENERLMNGGFVDVLPLDNHSLHVIQHSYLTSDPAARENPELVTRVMDHIMLHMNTWRSLDPQLLQALGLPIIQAPPPQANIPPSEGPPLAAPPEVGDSTGVQMPSMPKNAFSGEQAPAPDQGPTPPPGVTPAPM
jgi:hypothetical protein